MKSLQYISDEYLEHCRSLTPQQIAEFLESFRRLHEPPRKSKPISLRVEESLLTAFRRRCELLGERYQTRIKTLMREWLEAGALPPRTPRADPRDP